MATVVDGELRVVNPATLEIVGTVPATPPEAVDRLRSAWRGRGELLHLARRYPR
jgi:hypothetical protein